MERPWLAKSAQIGCSENLTDVEDNNITKEKNTKKKGDKKFERYNQMHEDWSNLRSLNVTILIAPTKERGKKR